LTQPGTLKAPKWEAKAIQGPGGVVLKKHNLKKKVLIVKKRRKKGGGKKRNRSVKENPRQR